MPGASALKAGHEAIEYKYDIEKCENSIPAEVGQGFHGR